LGTVPWCFFGFCRFSATLFQRQVADPATEKAAAVWKEECSALWRKTRRVYTEGQVFECTLFCSGSPSDTMSNTSKDIFFAALGEFVLSWVFAEAQIKALTERIAERRLADATLQELEFSGIEEALKAAASQELEPEIVARLQHVLELYVILRGYWQYWINPNLEDRSVHPDTFFAEYIFRKEIPQSHSGEVISLKKVTGDCYELGKYVHAITRYLRRHYDHADYVVALPEMRPIPPEIEN
jgi:hypothetical protein